MRIQERRGEHGFGVGRAIEAERIVGGALSEGGHDEAEL